MTDLRIPEAFLYMDYLVGAGTRRRVARRTRRAQGPPAGDSPPALSPGRDARAP